MEDGITPRHWDVRAREQRAVARVLAAAAFWADSYLHAGMALEFALKYRIMRHESLTVWPDRRKRPRLYSHDLPRLASLAGLGTRLARELARKSPFGTAWAIARDWDIDSRYDPLFLPEQGKLMLRAMDGMGLLEWLLNE
jgi:hypothetical protein